MVGRLFRIEGCLIKAQAVSGDLYNACFVVKSVWEPTQVLDWLSITRSSALGTLKIVERRIVKIINGTIDRISFVLLKPISKFLQESWPPSQVKLFLPGL